MTQELLPFLAIGLVLAFALIARLVMQGPDQPTPTATTPAPPTPRRRTRRR